MSDTSLGRRTRFAFAAPRIAHDARGIRATTVIRNTGARAGAAVAQLYVERVGGGWEAPRRLAGWARRTLAAGARQTATIAIDPRLLATFDTASGQWVIAPGRYRFRIGASSRDLGPPVDVTLPAARFGA